MVDNVRVKVEGLQDVLKAVENIFPKDDTAARAILNQGMGASMRKHMLPMAKQLAASTNKSGALAESLAVRAIQKRHLNDLPATANACVRLTPVMANRKAAALYINYYYLSKGKIPPDSIWTSGIRHGHLVEFGSVNNTPKPYILPSVRAGRAKFEKDWANFMWKKTKARVKRFVKKAKKVSSK